MRNRHTSVLVTGSIARRRRGIRRPWLLMLLATVLLVAVATPVTAGPITTVPTSLSEGDQYRLVFVTSTRRTGSSANIADYNTFVTNVANAVPELVDLGTTWKAIASTQSGVHARDNTGTRPTFAGGSLGVPIFLLNDTMLAVSNDDLWDKSILTPLAIQENGIARTTFEPYVWTGTAVSGRDAFYTLGFFKAEVGRYDLTNSAWVADRTYGTAFATFPLYAMSDVLIVPEPNPADFDGNCVVDLFDAAFFFSQWLWCGDPFEINCTSSAGITMLNDSFVQQRVRAYWWGHTPTQTITPLPFPGTESATASQANGNFPSGVNTGTVTYDGSLPGIFMVSADHSLLDGGFVTSTGSIQFNLAADYAYDLSGSYSAAGPLAETGFLNVHIKDLDTDIFIFQNSQSGLTLDVSGGSPTGSLNGVLPPGNYEFFVSTQMEGGQTFDLPGTPSLGSGAVTLIYAQLPYACTEDNPNPADFDGNCVVDLFDAAFFFSQWLWRGDPFEINCTTN